MTISNRKANHEINPIYTKRWSPRAFSSKKVEREKLDSVFEAARWAPSASNNQPWHYIFAESDEDKERFLSFILPGNTSWCVDAPILIAAVSKKTVDRSDKVQENKWHAFDTGTSWGFLALEAFRQGLVTHAMGGFKQEEAKGALQLTDDYEVQAMIALGYQGETADLTEELQEREVVSDRKEIESFVSEGLFSGKQL